MSDFETFQKRVNDVVFNHPVVTNNEYCQWVAKGEMTEEDVKDLTIQFSVFSHLFLEAQLKKVLASNTLEGYRAGKEILMNEFGVSFTKPGTTVDETDPNAVPTEGTVNGGKYRHTAAHFEWLLKFAEPLGLGFDQIGKRQMGTESTIHFCDALSEWYGNEDACVGAGASYAVENWAAAGFWKQLIAGLQAFSDQNPDKKLNLGFWKWHDMVEDQHAEHTHEELEEDFEEEWFNEEKYIEGATHILDAVQVFWDGLNKSRLERASITA